MEKEKCKCQPGAPGWMATFADLVTLLMCFFVLLLSFSEMDVLKFKQIAGSMKYAFGVQNQLDVRDIPKGTSVIAQEFRPGRPEPTPIEVIMQQTIDMTQRSLDFHEGETRRATGTQREEGNQTGGASTSTSSEQSSSSQSSSASAQSTAAADALMKMLQQALEREVSEGAVELDNLGQQVVIRIKEKGAFPAGSAFLQPKFRPLVRQVAELVKDVPGEITITGHTDSGPLDSELYRSKWDLSSQRAVSVAHEMESVEGFEPMRLRVVGMADTLPLVSNSTLEGRQANRRVEIAINQGKPHYSEEVTADPAARDE
uniref:flagellar motor protein MotB n=1 Tax=Thaumasiovibrio occultus TaxID=1891184 RepID=UPI000B3513B3|nr:flagellar motor protein MotB [Thaumasiovibrio occultus]